MPPQTSISEKNKEFWSESMLPAWFVTDENLSVVNTNAFGSTLLQQVCDRESLDGNLTFAVTKSESPMLSLWEELLSPGEEGLKYIEAALGVMKRHREILEKFNPISSNREPLTKALRKIKNEVENEFKFIKVNNFSPQPGSKVLQLGIKVAPLDGVQLKKEATVEDNSVKYVDIVIGYRLRLEPIGEDLQSIIFCGIQPAFHDCSSRREMTEKFKNAEAKNVTMFISHALSSPVTELLSYSSELAVAREGEDTLSYYRQIAESIEENTSNIYRLIDLIVFVNSSDSFETFLSPNPNVKGILKPYEEEEIETDKIIVTPDRIRRQINNTLDSVLRGGNQPLSHRKKIKILAKLSPNATEVTKTDCSVAVDSILDLRCLADYPHLYFGVRSKEDEKDPLKYPGLLASRINTVLLNLMLVELVLNAVKYADRNQPEVKCVFDLTHDDFLKIHIRNNGDFLKPEDFEKARERIASKSGEKRQALGLYLNRLVAEQLGWDFKCEDTQGNGTHLVLSIPFVRH